MESQNEQTIDLPLKMCCSPPTEARVTEIPDCPFALRKCTPTLAFQLKKKEVAII